MDELWRGIRNKGERQISWRIILAAARKEETQTMKGCKRRCVEGRIVCRDGTPKGNRPAGERTLGDLICKGRREAPPKKTTHTQNTKNLMIH